MESKTKSRADQPGISNPGGFLSRYGDKILTLAPVLFLVWVIVRYAVAVPFMDQWELVPLLEKTYHGDLTLGDVWAQHNEHRLIFPQLIMLILARATAWNIYYELAVNFLLALGIFFVFALQLKITQQKVGFTGLSWAFPAISLIVFSISQYQNWLWGWQLQMFLNLLAVAGGIVLLANESFRWWKFTGALLLGIVATYSFANGILFWPIGIVILLVVTTGSRQKLAGLLGWILIGSLTLGAYFYHYQKPEHHPSVGLVLEMPVAYVAYVFKYLGGICAGGMGGDPTADGVLALIFGVAVLVGVGWAGWTLVRRQIADVRTLFPYLALSMYSVGSALMTGVGRLGFGSDQALASRYSTMVTPLWVSLIVFLILLVQSRRIVSPASSARPEPHPQSSPRGFQTIARWSLVAAILFLAAGSVFSVRHAQNLSSRQAYGRARLLELAANPHAEIDHRGLAALYARTDSVVERCPVLMEHRLSVFREREVPAGSP